MLRITLFTQFKNGEVIFWERKHPEFIFILLVKKKDRKHYKDLEDFDNPNDFNK